MCQTSFLSSSLDHTSFLTGIADMHLALGSMVGGGIVHAEAPFGGKPHITKA